MPGRYYTRKRRMGPIVNSIKNVVTVAGSLTSANSTILVAKAVNSPVSTVATDVSQGSIIKAVWISLDVCGTLAGGVANSFTGMFFKNPGDNLTEPAPASVGTSNEKKFAFKMWRAMIMATTDGNVPYHWEGWVRVPKRYQRMGTDDTLKVILAATAAGTGLHSSMYIYKWYR